MRQIQNFVGHGVSYMKNSINKNSYTVSIDFYIMYGIYVSELYLVDLIDVSFDIYIYDRCII